MLQSPMPPKPSLTKFPLSGDVLQTINPWTWWNSAVNQLGGQFGLININTMASGDPALEQNIVQNVASYGRQLGRVADVLNVLIATKGNLAQLTPAQQQQIDAFQQLTEQINAAKKDHPQELSSADTQKFLDRLTALKAANPALYDTLRKKINAAINA
jgi:hypothetical protein